MASAAQGISHETFSLLSLCIQRAAVAQGEMKHMPLFKGYFYYIKDFFLPFAENLNPVFIRLSVSIEMHLLQFGIVPLREAEEVAAFHRRTLTYNSNVISRDSDPSAIRRCGWVQAQERLFQRRKLIVVSFRGDKSHFVCSIRWRRESVQTFFSVQTSWKICACFLCQYKCYDLLFSTVQPVITLSNSVSLIIAAVWTCAVWSFASKGKKVKNPTLDWYTLVSRFTYA